jgi:hypothetical protein
VVTHLSTNPPLSFLIIRERTGSNASTKKWSYVKGLIIAMLISPFECGSQMIETASIVSLVYFCLSCLYTSSIHSFYHLSTPVLFTSPPHLPVHDPYTPSIHSLCPSILPFFTPCVPSFPSFTLLLRLHNRLINTHNPDYKLLIPHIPPSLASSFPIPIHERTKSWVF